MPEEKPSPTIEPTPTPEPEPAGKKVSLAIPGVMPDPTPVEEEILGEFMAADLNEPVVKFDKSKPGEESIPPQPQPPDAEGSPGEEAPAGEVAPIAAPLPDVIEGTPDEIMQKYKSLQGQFTNMNSQIGDLSTELDAANQFFGSLRRDGVIDEDGNIVAKAPAAPDPETPPKAPKEFSIADVTDFDYVSDKLSEAIASGDKKTTDEAIAGLLVAVDKFVKQKGELDKATFDKKLEGLTQIELNMKVMNQAAELFKKVGNTYDSKAGAYVYPELRDKEKAEEILEIWQTMEPASAMTQRGVYDAWLEWKHRKGHFSGESAPPTKEVDLGGAHQLLENKKKARKTSSDSVLAGGGAPPVTPHTNTTTSPDAVTQQFLRRVKESAKPIGSLGFAE